MTRKKYVKQLMAAGADRNTANLWAHANRLSGWTYSESVESDRTTCKVLRDFGLRPKYHHPPIRPRRSCINHGRVVFVDEWSKDTRTAARLYEVGLSAAGSILQRGEMVSCETSKIS